jgi:hypothetical protein
VVLAFLYFLGSYFKLKLDGTAYLNTDEDMLEINSIVTTSILK